ncbi:hypothetical protein HY995_01640 [Candidatus Micrarchaeota archaeon]|nr:hypothetical protein [Candidatus Micrarchaeota archaeon]MBI5176770.1 hypothetical protein [Candidatus Micrarchaeota archaeon]
MAGQLIAEAAFNWQTSLMMLLTMSVIAVAAAIMHACFKRTKMGKRAS